MSASTTILFTIKGVGAVGDNEPIAHLWRSSSETYMLHSSEYGDPKLPHLSADLQPRPPQSHSPGNYDPPPCHAHANRPTPFPQQGEARLQSYQNSGGNASCSSTILRQKVVMHRPNTSRSMSV